MEKSEFAFVVIGYCCLGLDPEHFSVTCAQEFYVNHLKSKTSHFKSFFGCIVHAQGDRELFVR